MQINVSQQLKASMGSTREYEVSEIVDLAGGRSMVQGEVGLMRTDRGILARGRLHTDVEVTCSRCLDLFSCPLVINIEEEYFPIADLDGDDSLLMPGETGCFTINEHQVMDLTEVIRQGALLAIPMKPLCRRDCAGLCSGCGRNLNQGTCHCSSRETDARWSELSKLTLAGDAVANELKGTE